MEKMKMETPNLTEHNIEKIAELFPNCITEGKDENGKIKKLINFDMLKQMLSDSVTEGKEVYEFTWPGKKEAIIEANTPIRKTLRPYKEESKNWDTTENLYIEGDNLEVLKLIQESYLGKVKMIYIDPPYNTGNDFIYKDHFKTAKDEFDLLIGDVSKDGKHLVKNVESNGRFHSDWCSMIYGRLILARKLLDDKNGVLAISIGYQEKANLIKICQEIFPDRQLMDIAVQTSGGKPNGAFSITNENIIVIVPKDFESISTEEDMKSYNSPYHGMNLATFNQTQRPNQTYPIYINQEGEIVGVGKSLQERIDDGSFVGRLSEFVFDFNEAPSGCTSVWPVTNKNEQCVWRLIPSRLISDWKKGYIKVVPQNNKNLLTKYSIQYLSGGIISKIETGELKTKKFNINPRIPTIDVLDYKTNGAGIPTVWTDKSFYTANGGSQIKKLFGSKVFSYPKPVELIEYLLKKTTSSNDIILDFFAGSSTTAQAVMKLNADTGESRKFIMIQLNEKCDPESEAFKKGLTTLCDIGKERIRRAGEKIKSEHPEAKDLDIGFRVLKVDSSNMNDVYYTPDDYSQGLLDHFESNIKEDRSSLDLLFGCLLDWGLPLSLPYTSEEIEGFTVHNYNDGDLIACFDENISDSVIKEIANGKPLRAVFRDSSFASNPSKINVTEIFKMLSPDTTVKVI